MNRRVGPSLRRRLVAVTVGSSGTALLVACCAFIALDAISAHQQAVGELRTTAEMFAYGSGAVLEFGDRSGAAEMLSGMRAEPDIVRAGLYDENGRLFASHRAEEGEAQPLWATAPPEHERLGSRAIRVVVDVVVDGEPIGSLAVEKSLTGLYRQMGIDAAVVLAVLLGCCALVFRLGSRLVGRVTAPILELAQLAREITHTQDYARRATVPESEEVGVLAVTLNAMLERIERDTDLHAQREHLRQINSALEHEKDRALMAARAKSEFLANMSHEIRTPITSILGYIDLVCSERMDKQQMDEMLEIVRRNSRHLLTVINDILDLSKLESGRLQLEHIWCSPQSIVAEATDLMLARASAKGLRLETEYAGAVPGRIRSDPTRVRQILLNLLSNAIKFTSEGSVRTTVYMEEETEDRPGHLIFEVEDTGIGISEDKQQSVFEAFSQADSSTTRCYGGTGLGLSISARLADLLDGELQLVRSQPQEGTTMAFRVPLGAPLGETQVHQIDALAAPEKRAARTDQPVPSELSGRVLLAEDSPDTQRLVRTVLRRAGLTVEVADNGAIACEMAREARELDEPYDVVLMDMQMPVMDGYTASRVLRDEGFEQPIVAFTAHAMSGEREKCLAAGCSDYASKPIDRAALLRLLADLLAKD